MGYFGAFFVYSQLARVFHMTDYDKMLVHHCPLVDNYLSELRRAQS